MYLYHTPKKASFGSPEGKNVSGFQNKICQMILCVLSVNAKFHAPKFSVTSPPLGLSTCNSGTVSG